MSLTSIDTVELQAQTLALTWKAHFAEQDAALHYTQVETARFLEVAPGIWLVGIVDAEGDDFFGEWKTSSPRAAKTWKKNWVMSPQALTYGLLTGGKKRFLVRKVFKAAQPFCDHEWFEFGAGELDMWRNEILRISHEIKRYQSDGNWPLDIINWPLNLEHGCFAYGPNYPCSLWAEGCSKLDFSVVPKDALTRTTAVHADVTSQRIIDMWGEFRGNNRWSLVKLIQDNPNAIVLSATRIKDWMRCREMYRRLHVEGLRFPPSEAMLIGSRFHELIADHNKTFIKETTNG